MSVTEEWRGVLDRAAAMLESAERLCVLTGAGVSAESGVPTFRGSDGLWEGHPIVEVASPQGWEKNPLRVWNFYHARRANVARVRPNPAHDALVRMERRWGDRFTLVTQNVDGLHHLAGSQNVIEIHGNLRRTRCLSCGDVADRGLEPLEGIPECPVCGGILRPDIVWFGEIVPPQFWRASESAARDCDLLLVVGTSAVVYPAAGLIPLARGIKSSGRKGQVIECNLTKTEASWMADLGLYGPAGHILPELCDRIGI
jgi:NAD-dependent deacetylase